MSSKSENVLEKIFDLRRKDKDKLVAYVRGLAEVDIKYVVTANLVSSRGGELLDALSLGLSRDSDQKKLYALLAQVLLICREKSTPSTLTQTYLTSVLLEIPHLSSEYLVKMIQESVESISKHNDHHTSWKDILPECVHVLRNRGGQITHCDTAMSASEFVSQCVRSLCQIKWPESIVVSLASMFLKIALDKEEHLQIVNKLCCHFENYNPESLPSLLHQLLRLCENQHGAMIYFRMNDYFYKRLYASQLAKEDHFLDSESPIMELDTIDDYSDDEIQKAEATCIYFGTKGGGAFAKFLTTLKTMTRRPQTILQSPTLIQILLASEQQKDACIQIIRSSLYYHYLEEIKRTDFAWTKEILPERIKIKTLIDVLVENSNKHCHVIGEGLLSLAISLISTGGLFPMAHKLQELGTLLLIKLLKKKPEATSFAMKQLRHKLISESVNLCNIAETLKLLSLQIPHTMMECTPIMQGIVEDCIMMPESRNWSDHKLIIEAFSNIVKLNSRLRDTIVMMCRKGLFAHDDGINKIAVCGFLSLIKTLKGSSDALSQENSCSFSVLSQISMNAQSTHPSTSLRINNGTICMEIISILRRCIKQNAEVREQLYIDLAYAIHNRAELHDSIFNILYDHLTSKYYASDVEALPPILLEKCIVAKDGDVALQEPLGRLLFTIQQLLVCEPGRDEPGGWSLSGAPEKFHGIAGKLYGILLSIANRLTKCTLNELNSNPSVPFNDISEESRVKCLVFQQTLLCYEALMAFRINEWTQTKTDQPYKLINLQKMYLMILDYAKGNNTKEGSKNAKKSKNKDTSQNKSTEEENASSAKKTVKLSSLIKKANVGFKLPTTVWDSYTLNRALELLYSDSITWSTLDQLNVVRTKRDLHRSIIKLGISTILSYKSRRISSQSKQQLQSCAKILYKQCISRLNDFVEFDQETALLTVECFHELTQLIINNPTFKFSDFLSSIDDSRENETLAEKISAISETLSVQLEALFDNTSLLEEPSGQKIIPTFFQLISLFMQKLPAETALCRKWVEWLQKLASKDCNQSKNIGSMIINTIFNLITKSADAWTVCELITKKLCQEMGTDEEKENTIDEPAIIDDFSIINSSSSTSVYLALCSHLNTEFATIETVIGRLRADRAFLQFRRPDQLMTAQATMKNRERVVCAELCRAAKVVQELATILCPAGPCCDNIIKLVSRLYSMLALMAAHFMLRDPQAIHSTRFDSVVKLSGRPMSRAIDSLISHVESARKGNVLKNVKGQARMLKDTKNIPRLVYNCELFYKRVNQLSAKMKIDLVSYMSKGNGRDFRIKASTVKKVLQSNEPENEFDLEEIEEHEEEVPASPVIDLEAEDVASEQEDEDE